LRSTVSIGLFVLAFNETLAENHSVNRLVLVFISSFISCPNRLQADSLKLWRTICSNKLLISVEFILVGVTQSRLSAARLTSVQFLNKVDILTRKIQAGIRFAEHVTSFRNKPNEPKEVIKCEWLSCCSWSGVDLMPATDLSDAFATINQTYSPRKRKMHRHVTCAIVRRPLRHHLPDLILLLTPAPGYESNGHRH
jgi:hypothetical protein